MESQVSFRFDGRHNKHTIIGLLRSKINGLKYRMEEETGYVYKVYVASTTLNKEETLSICKTIQQYAILDSSKTI